jgi:cytochrome P450
VTVAQISSREAEETIVRLFRTSEGRSDPYTLYHRIRELSPVHQSDDLHAWVLSRYDDCAAALRDPRLGKDYPRTMDVRRPDWRNRPSMVRGEQSMLNTDGPYHTRLRKLVSREFTPRNVEALRPRIEAMVDGYLDILADGGGGDLMSLVAFPLPVQVIGELLGVPEEDRPQFREWTRDTTAVFEVGASDEALDRADIAAVKTDEYFYELIAAKRAHPDDALISGLLVAGDDGDRLTDDELVTLSSLLFGAGFETTTNLIGNGMVALFAHPDQIELLRTRPDACPDISDELLRYDGTAQLSLRFVKEDVSFDGHTIAEGSTVYTLLGAGNHDPAQFSDPDRLDLTRSPVKPLSFGGGVHFCLGAALARLEIEIFFRKMFDRFDVVEPEAEPVFRDRLTLRGVPELRIRVREGAATTPTVAVPSRPPEPVPVAGQDEFLADGILPPRPGGESDRAWRAAFRRQLDEHGRDETEIVSMVALLRRVPLFRGCTPDELESLARGAFMIGFERGDQLCVEGADAPECYVIAEGEAECTIGGTSVATVTLDDVVGELGPLSGRPRAATVTATTHLVAYAISRDELGRLVETSPRAAAAIRSELDSKYRERR